METRALAPGFEFFADNTMVRCADCGTTCRVSDARIKHGKRCDKAGVVEELFVTEQVVAAPAVTVPAGVWTNRREQICETCREMRAPGTGRLERAFSHDDEPAGWNVFCLDTTACAARVEARKVAEIARKERVKIAAEQERVTRVALESVFAHGTNPSMEHAPTGDAVSSGRKSVVVESADTPDRGVWILLRNSSDGDDWNHNNVGGHSIGRRVDWTPATEALVHAWRDSLAALKAAQNS